MGAKSEISWRGRDEHGNRREVYARRAGDEWRFFVREKRFEEWQPLESPPLEDWLALLDAVRRRISRRLLQPSDEALLRRRIREKFPDEAFE